MITLEIEMGEIEIVEMDGDLLVRVPLFIDGEAAGEIKMALDEMEL